MRNNSVASLIDTLVPLHVHLFEHQDGGDQSNHTMSW